MRCALRETVVVAFCVEFSIMRAPIHMGCFYLPWLMYVNMAGSLVLLPSINTKP